MTLCWSHSSSTPSVSIRLTRSGSERSGTRQEARPRHSSRTPSASSRHSQSFRPPGRSVPPHSSSNTRISSFCWSSETARQSRRARRRSWRLARGPRANELAQHANDRPVVRPLRVDVQRGTLQPCGVRLQGFGPQLTRCLNGQSRRALITKKREELPDAAELAVTGTAPQRIAVPIERSGHVAIELRKSANSPKSKTCGGRSGRSSNRTTMGSTSASEPMTISVTGVAFPARAHWSV